MNLTSRDLIKDPYYQLQSGDIIYVEPNKARLNTTSTFFQIWPTVASAVTLIILAVNLSN
jgi:polysaccharide export outer membrane protein